jgi:hypothetical protein
MRTTLLRTPRPGGREVDDELSQPAMTIFLVGGPAQGDHEVVTVRARGPHLGSVDDPPVRVTSRPGADRRQVTAGVRLAHADGEPELTAADTGQEPCFLLVGPEPVDYGTALPVSHPVMTDRSPAAQQLLGDDEPFDRASLGAAVLCGQRHAEPAPRAELLGELAVSGSVHAQPGPTAGIAQLVG